MDIPAAQQTEDLSRPLGAHTSIAGGLPKAVERAKRLDATALQIFTRNQVRWQSPPVQPAVAQAFRLAVDDSNIAFVCAHSSYLINMASPDAEIRQRSMAALLEETRRADVLGCRCLVLHPGSPKTDSPMVAVRRVAKGLMRVLDETAGASVGIALENTAGQGACLGSGIEQLAEIADQAQWPERLGMCLDSAHAYAAGYDLSDRNAVNDLVNQIASTYGIGRLWLMHLNDSQSELGSHRDRHADIGSGSIGSAGFSYLLNHPQLKKIPGIIETPKGENALAADRRNLKKLRQLV